MADDARRSLINDFDDDAEVLFLQHLDLLSQLEAQLRAVHHTMRSIERLRGGSRHVGPALVNGERETLLIELASEVDALESHLGIEQQCCHEMQATIVEMQTRVKALKRLAAQQREAEEAASTNEQNP